MEVETMITEELVAAAKENGVEVAQKLASIVSGDPLSISMLGTNKVVLRYHEGKLHWLDNIFMAPNIVLLWNADLTSP